jgi:Mannosyltransferase (PIG-V)
MSRVRTRHRATLDSTACWTAIRSNAEPDVPVNSEPVELTQAEPTRATRGVLGALGSLRADPIRMAAVRDSWRALWSSRLLVWAAGIMAGATLTRAAAGAAPDPRGLTRGLGSVGELLAGPAARWDAAWYLVIARDGPQPGLGAHTFPRVAFFPLYPLAIRVLGLVTPLVIAGVVVSLCAFAAALYGIHRLTVLEFARKPQMIPTRPQNIARLAVLVIAFSPMAVFFSAIYTESLFMALSVAVFWCARQGRWAWVGIAGALACATRSNGLLLALPVLVIYLYGPREDRPPDRTGQAAATLHAGATMASLRGALAALRPRYRARPEMLWLALLPAGIIAYGCWLSLTGGDALSPFTVQHQAWSRHFVGPVVGLWDGARAAFNSAPELLSALFLVAAIPATVGVLRRLPLAYGLYVIASVLVVISYPGEKEPLESLPRYLLVLFPLGIWLAAWLEEHPPLRRPVIVLSALAMAALVTRFATWHFIS